MRWTCEQCFRNCGHHLCVIGEAVVKFRKARKVLGHRWLEFDWCAYRIANGLTENASQNAILYLIHTFL